MKKLITLLGRSLLSFIVVFPLGSGWDMQRHPSEPDPSGFQAPAAPIPSKGAPSAKGDKVIKEKTKKRKATRKPHPQKKTKYNLKTQRK